ncbi:MAG: NACHT domain-containing protein [Halieaceae bacterium]|nr:NACHT domain-containing protein [Halieaceae bacterium]
MSNNFEHITGENVILPGAQQTIIIDGLPIELPTWDALVAHLHEVAAYPAYERWADPPGDGVDAEASPLYEQAAAARVLPDTYLQVSATPLPQRLSPWRPLASGDLEQAQGLLEALAGVQRAVILGEPGSGKTTALERLAWVTAAHSLAELEAGSGVLHIPLFIHLREYHRNQGELLPLLCAALCHHDVLSLDERTTRGLLRSFRNVRFILLLDGLNEMGEHSGDGLKALARCLKTYPGHTYYLTCRTADFDADMQTPEEAGVWQVQPLQDGIRYWGDEQGQSDVRDYLQRHLGEARGRRLYERVRSDDRLREAATLPLLLFMIKEAGGAGELPPDRGGLVRQFVRSHRLLRRVPKRLRLQAERSLEAICWTMQMDLRSLSIPKQVLDDTLTAVQGQSDYSIDTMLEQLQTTGLLVPPAEVHDPYLLLHQIIQEYGAASQLAAQRVQLRNMIFAELPARVRSYYKN